MKKIIIIVIAVLVIAGGIYAYKSSKHVEVDSIPVSGTINVTPTTNLKAFTVERVDISSPMFLVIGFELSKVEVWYVPVGGALSSPKKFGDMEMVEANAKGEQTWLLEVPQKKMDLSAVFVKAYDNAGKNVGELALVVKGKEGLNSELWPAIPTPALTGSVTSITGSTFVLKAGKPIAGEIKVTVDAKATILDSKGKPVTVSSIKKGSNVTVIGKYTDDGAFTANQVEIN